ncbi:MAG TPA: S1 RNA-binding domain-containing protein, partial [bacterium]|nr:S1 RNA-binding domain-containing protein [bacterium]
GLIENPSQILKVGEKIKVQIIKITEDKIFLSLKALKKNPWEGITKKYKKGDKVSGKVIKFNPFGVFIEITPEIQGLIHISEFGTQGKMEEKLEQGKKYKFEITEVNPENYRIILKLIEK